MKCDRACSRVSALNASACNKVVCPPRFAARVTRVRVCSTEQQAPRWLGASPAGRTAAQFRRSGLAGPRDLDASAQPSRVSSEVPVTWRHVPLSYVAPRGHRTLLRGGIGLATIKSAIRMAAAAGQPVRRKTRAARAARLCIIRFHFFISRKKLNLYRESHSLGQTAEQGQASGAGRDCGSKRGDSRASALLRLCGAGRAARSQFERGKAGTPAVGP